MERSTINTLDPGRNWGIGFTEISPNERMTLAGGLFQSGTDASDLQFGQGSTTALTVRATGLALYENHGTTFMHFGMAISERIANQGFINVNLSPRSLLLDFVDSTESPFVPRMKIPATFQQLINLQWAASNGPLWSQAEWYGSIIDQQGGPPIFFRGSHFDFGYFLTGEHREYLTRSGVFGAVSVRHPVFSGFSSKKQEEVLGYGAWELTGRFSELDFIDSATPSTTLGQQIGVRMPQVTAGVNWYPADRLRIMVNYSYAMPEEVSTGTSTASIVGLRAATYW